MVINIERLTQASVTGGETGRMLLKIMYPVTLPINTGLTRFSLELR